MEKIEHVQTIMTSRDLARLKEKTGTGSTKDALIRAVEYFFQKHPDKKTITIDAEAGTEVTTTALSERV